MLKFKLGIFILVLVVFLSTQATKLSKPTVNDPVKSLAARIFSSCSIYKIDDLSIENDREHCYYRQFIELAKDHDIDSTISTLFQLEELDSSARGCHLIAHAISYGEAIKDPQGWQSLQGKINPNACTGGFIHGILEARARFDSNFSLNETSIPEICHDFGKTFKEAAEFDCAHIMGHLLLVDQSGDIAKSVDICTKVPKEMQFECFSGVFMENETREGLVAHGLAPYITWDQSTTHDQEKICQQYSGAAAQACWREISHMYSYISDDDPTKVYSLCYSIPFSGATGYCYGHALVIMATKDNLKEDALQKICQPFLSQEPIFNNCMREVVAGLLFSSTSYIDRTVNFCEVVPDKARKDCFSMLGNDLKNVTTPEEQKALCLKVPDNYREFCKH